jgi:hypothetical protein
MIAIATKSNAPSVEASSECEAGWRHRFGDMLPSICRHARLYFRGLPAEARGEAVQEVAAQAFVAYARLVQLGKEDVAYAAPLAKYAVQRVRSGRTVGGKLNVDDVTSTWCQARRNIRVDSLHEHDGQDGWREIVVEDRKCGPAEVVATRLDFADWLASLPCRQREVAEALAAGHETGLVARMFGVSPGRIAQLRKVLHKAWCGFQGEDESVAMPAVECA